MPAGVGVSGGQLHATGLTPPSPSSTMAGTAGEGGGTGTGSGSGSGSATVAGAAGAGGSVTSAQRKEVDYYLNPTELFRWINYRRWDGAKARVLSHPDECSTWIVSRHSSDGRILWRHLPLHLVCMQSEGESSDPSNPANHNTRQIEELIDVLLDAHPEAASSPDDQGMLPLHLAVANSAHPNENVLNLLLMAHPTAVDAKDNHGRTPVDLLGEKAETGPHRAAALRAMARAQRTTAKMVELLRQENTSVLASVKQAASNERMASQRIIMRLEEELEKARKEMEDTTATSNQKDEASSRLQAEIEFLKGQIESAQSTTQSLRRERDDFMNQNEVLRSQTQEHEKVVRKLHEDFRNETEEQADMIATLKSEVSTSKAMADGLQSQLRSRFTNEEYLTKSVSDLEKELSDLKAEYLQDKKKLMHERDSYENENTTLKRSAEELSKKKLELQQKLTELNKQMSGILSSHGALNSEHDRLLEVTLRTETDLLENMRAERSEVAAAMQKQLDLIQIAAEQQEQAMADFQQKEDDLISLAKEDRERTLEAISRMRQDFRDARSSAVERLRWHQPDVPRTDSYSVQKTSSRSSRTNRSDGSTMAGSAIASSHLGAGAGGGGSRLGYERPDNTAYPGPERSRYEQSSKPKMGGGPSFSIDPMVSRSFESRQPPPTTMTEETGMGHFHSNNHNHNNHNHVNNNNNLNSSGGTGQRQGVDIGPQSDGNLLNLLEQRAEQGSPRPLQFSVDTSTYGGSAVSGTAGTGTGTGSSSGPGPTRRVMVGSRPERKPRMIDVTTPGLNSSTSLSKRPSRASGGGSSASRGPSSSSMREMTASTKNGSRGEHTNISTTTSTTTGRSKAVRHLPSLSLDEYSVDHSNSSGSMDSDSESSSRDDRKSGRNNSRGVGHYGTGMMRIVEDASDRE